LFSIFLLFDSTQKLEELSDFNRKQMEQVYSNAIERAAEEIDQCAAAHAVVKKIVKRYVLTCAALVAPLSVLHSSPT
jgi:predicted metal-dependent hydrolase